MDKAPDTAATPDQPSQPLPPPTMSADAPTKERVDKPADTSADKPADTPTLDPPSSSEKGDQEVQVVQEAKDVDENGNEEEPQWVEGYKLAIVIASIALSCFLMLLDTMIISTAIPRITDQFNSLPDVGWYASAYQFGSAAPQLLTGKVYTHFNNKWSFLAFFGIFEVGSVLCGAAISSNMLIVGRAIAGFGAAGIIIGAITIISSCVPMEKRPGLIGITMGVNQLGLVAGPLIGGAFTDYSTWRWCFYVNLPAGAVAVIAIILLRIPEQTKKRPALEILPRLHHHLDLVGFLLFAPAVLQLLLALQYGGHQFAWRSSVVIGLFCGSGATFIAWFLWNRYKGEEALMPHSMVGRREVWSSGFFNAFLMAAVYGAVYYLPIYFQAINDATPMLSGVYLLPFILPQLVMAGASGGIITKIGYVIPLAIFSSVLLSISSGLYSILDPGSPTGEWVGFQIMGGLGSGAGLQVGIIAIQAVVTGEELSSGMAFLIFMQSLGPAIVLILCNVIFIENFQSQLRTHAPNADAAQIVASGATGFRKFVESSDLAGVLMAYANSINRVMYLVAAMAALCGVFALGMGWHDVRNLGKPAETPSTEGSEKADTAEP